jgi:putative transposase
VHAALSHTFPDRLIEQTTPLSAISRWNCSLVSSLKTERTSNKTYRTRNEAKADVFDYIERFYNSKRRHSTIGYLSPMEFERQAGYERMIERLPECVRRGEDVICARCRWRVVCRHCG